MNPFDFLQTCTSLAAAAPRREADERTILSRLYYAFFLALRDGLASKDQGFKARVKHEAADHALVRRYLKGIRYSPSGEENASGGRRVAWYERYDDLCMWREKADYRMDVSHEEISKKVSEFMDDLPKLQPLVENFVR